MIVLFELYLRLECQRVLLKQLIDGPSTIHAVGLIRTAMTSTVLARQTRRKALAVQFQAPRLFAITRHPSPLWFELKLLWSCCLSTETGCDPSLAFSSQTFESLLLNELKLFVLVPAYSFLILLEFLICVSCFSHNRLYLLMAVQIDDCFLLNLSTTAPSAHPRRFTRGRRPPYAKLHVLQVNLNSHFLFR